VDPVDPGSHALLASSLASAERYTEARAEYERVIELNRSAPNSYAALGGCYLSEGKPEEAIAAAQKDVAGWARLLTVTCAHWTQKRFAESDAALKEFIANYGETAAYQIAGAYGYRQDKDQAFDWLERAHRQRDAGLSSLRTDTFLRPLHSDPRWNALLRSMGLADDQLKTIDQ